MERNLLKVALLFLAILCVGCQKLGLNNYVEFVVINNSSFNLAWVEVYSLDKGKDEINGKKTIIRFENVVKGSSTQIYRTYLKDVSSSGIGRLLVNCQYEGRHDIMKTGLGGYKHYRLEAYADYAPPSWKTHEIEVTDEYGPQGGLSHYSKEGEFIERF